MIRAPRRRMEARSELRRRDGIAVAALAKWGASRIGEPIANSGRCLAAVRGRIARVHHTSSAGMRFLARLHRIAARQRTRYPR